MVFTQNPVSKRNIANKIIVLKIYIFVCVQALGGIAHETAFRGNSELSFVTFLPLVYSRCGKHHFISTLGGGGLGGSSKVGYLCRP